MTTTPVAAAPLPLEGGDAGGPAKPDPRRLLDTLRSHHASFASESVR